MLCLFRFFTPPTTRQDAVDAVDAVVMRVLRVSSFLQDFSIEEVHLAMLVVLPVSVFLETLSALFCFSFSEVMLASLALRALDRVRTVY